MALSVHRQSEQMVAQGDLLWAAGRVDLAREAYAQAADAEARVLWEIAANRPRTFSIIGVAAVELNRRAARYEAAMALAHKIIVDDRCQPFAKRQLESQLTELWRLRDAASQELEISNEGIELVLAGAAIIHGLAPVRLVSQKIAQFVGYCNRLADWANEVQFSPRGPTQTESHGLYTPLIGEPLRGSLRLEFRLQRALQPELPFGVPGAVVGPDRVVELVSEVTEAIVDGSPDDFRKLVPDPQYRVVFARLVRNLAPNGRDLSRVELRREHAGLSTDSSLSLDATARESAAAQLHALQQLDAGSVEPSRTRATGVLRGVDLDKKWVKLVTDVGEQTFFFERGRIIDDLIEPLLNHRVHVIGRKSSASAKPIVDDIVEATAESGERIGGHEDRDQSPEVRTRPTAGTRPLWG